MAKTTKDSDGIGRSSNQGQIVQLRRIFNLPKVGERVTCRKKLKKPLYHIVKNMLRELQNVMKFDLTIEKKVSFHLPCTLSEIKEIEDGLCKRKKEIDKFRKRIEEIDELDLRDTNNESYVPKKDGDWKMIYGTPKKAMEEIQITAQQGEISKSIEKMSLIGHDSIGSASALLRAIPKDFIAKTFSLSRMYSSKVPIEALSDWIEDDEEDGTEEADTTVYQCSEKYNRKGLNEVETDLERLKNEIHLSNTVWDEVKNELYELKDAISNVAVIGKVGEKIAKAQIMAAKLKEAAKIAEQMLLFRSNPLNQKKSDNNPETLSAELNVKTTKTESVLLSWTPSQDLQGRQISAYLIYVNGQIFHKVRNPSRKQAVLSKIEPNSEITLYLELADGEKVPVGTTMKQAY